LRIVAEGVEDSDTLRTLDSYGCDVIQGYFFSRPLPAPELTRWLEARPNAGMRDEAVSGSSAK
jgi:EAL domain-containing protein (putative c-di-GMP-specific phosphodiesterase class I)